MSQLNTLGEIHHRENLDHSNTINSNWEKLIILKEKTIDAFLFSIQDAAKNTESFYHNEQSYKQYAQLLLSFNPPLKVDLGFVDIKNLNNPKNIWIVNGRVMDGLPKIIQESLLKINEKTSKNIADAPILKDTEIFTDKNIPTEELLLYIDIFSLEINKNDTNILPILLKIYKDLCQYSDMKIAPPTEFQEKLKKIILQGKMNKENHVKIQRIEELKNVFIESASNNTPLDLAQLKNYEDIFPTEGLNKSQIEQRLLNILQEIEPLREKRTKELSTIIINVKNIFPKYPQIFTDTVANQQDFSLDFVQTAIEYPNTIIPFSPEKKDILSAIILLRSLLIEEVNNININDIKTLITIISQNKNSPYYEYIKEQILYIAEKINQKDYVNGILLDANLKG